MQPTVKMPLFIVTGASCAEKSTVCKIKLLDTTDMTPKRAAAVLRRWVEGLL